MSMIKQFFDIENYWKVIVYYDVDFNFFEEVIKKIKNIGASSDVIQELYKTLAKGKTKAFTYSNTDKHVSVIVFSEHQNKQDYINSIIHEAEHVKQAILEAYLVDDEGEAPAYTIGYLVSCMYRVFRKILCNCEES